MKTTLTIKNYLGGFYFFTCDEIKIDNNDIYLIEGKHSKHGVIPSLEDIKDGLMKMILFTNLKEVVLNGKKYCHKSVLKLTSEIGIKVGRLSDKDIDVLRTLNEESNFNGFEVTINDEDLCEIIKKL